MATGPGNTVPSAEEPRNQGISLAGRDQPPPFTRTVDASLICRPTCHRFGFPADVVTWMVLDRPSGQSAKRRFLVFEIAPSPATPTKPIVTISGSTPGL